MKASAPGFHSFNLLDKVIAPAPLRPRALWRVDTCEVFLDLDRDAIIHRIEDGRLAWAWCISSPTVARRELRVLAASVFEVAGLKTGLAKPTGDMTFEEVLELVLPHHRSTLRGVELQQVLSCRSDMIRYITRRRGFKIAVRAKTRFGPYSSHKFSRESVIEFLRKGRVLS